MARFASLDWHITPDNPLTYFTVKPKTAVMSRVYEAPPDFVSDLRVVVHEDADLYHDTTIYFRVPCPEHRDMLDARRRRGGEFEVYLYTMTKNGRMVWSGSVGLGYVGKFEDWYMGNFHPGHPFANPGEYTMTFCRGMMPAT